MPDDGHRYELVDGSLLVTPAPSLLHQRVVGNLYLALRAGCPADLEVFVAPVDVVLGPHTVMQPDVLVGRRADLTERNLPAAPVLAVEVLSPSTHHIDLGTKRLAFEAAGVPSYWVVDPDEPRVTVLELAGNAYGEVAVVTAGQVWEAVRPFPVRVAADDLLQG
jgi:Uma2 family endonuclease